MHFHCQLFKDCFELLDSLRAAKWDINVAAKNIRSEGGGSDEFVPDGEPKPDTDGAIATSAPDSGSSNADPSGHESPRASTSATPSLHQTSRSLNNSPSVVNISGHKYFIVPHPESKAAAARPVKATTSGGISVAMANAKIAF